MLSMTPNAIAARKYRDKLHSESRCVRCGVEITSEYTTCDACRKISTEYKRVYYLNNKKKCSEYNKKYYQRRPEKKIEDSRQEKAKNREIWYAYFNSIGMNKCSKCGYNKCWSAIEFHHIDPKEKEVVVSELVLRKMTETRKEEVNKCITLCANCHRELHYNERVANGSRIVRGMS
jgi:hypothetical protein